MHSLLKFEVVEILSINPGCVKFGHLFNGFGLPEILKLGWQPFNVCHAAILMPIAWREQEDNSNALKCRLTTMEVKSFRTTIKIVI